MNNQQLVQRIDCSLLIVHCSLLIQKPCRSRTGQRSVLRNSIPVDYPTNTLSQMLEGVARQWPNRTAYVYFGARISYREFLDQVNRPATGLQALGVRPGERVVVQGVFVLKSEARKDELKGHEH